MRISIITIGSLGDVQPYVALGAGLARAGYEVTFVADASFAPLVAERGLDRRIGFAPLRADFLRLLETPEGRAALVGGGNKLALMRKVMPVFRRILDDAWAAARGSDAVVYNPKALAGYHVAERLGVPGFLAHPVPAFTPTRELPNPLLPAGLGLGGALNRLTYTAVNRLITAPYRGLINAWRRDALGLPARPFLADDLVQNGRPVPRIYGVSRQVVPQPADWGDSSELTGYWFLDSSPDWMPPTDLADFLAAGPPPVYVGFGSMASQDAAAVARTVVSALERAGQRGVLATGTGGLAPGDLPPTVFPIRSAPHDWLFPRMAAVVHHGGAGTTAAGIRAGMPSVICPFFGDQPFWGARVASLGVGPAPIPQKRLTVERLAAAIGTAVGDPAIRERAADLGARVRAEDGVGRAVEAIRRRL